MLKTLELTQRQMDVLLIYLEDCIDDRNASLRKVKAEKVLAQFGIIRGQKASQTT